MTVPSRDVSKILESLSPDIEVVCKHVLALSLGDIVKLKAHLEADALEDARRSVEEAQNAVATATRQYDELCNKLEADKDGR